jgi:hypothetical protein
MRALRIAMLLAAIAAPVAAQQQSAPLGSTGEFVVRTVPLHHLTPAEAVKLLSPYRQTSGGGVFEAPGIRAVTIREVPKVFADMMAVLAQYDREPSNVTLYFQLIAAESTTVRDPAVVGLDSLLRGVLRFSGYRLLSTAVASASEGQNVTQSLTANGDPLTLSVDVSEVRIDGNDGSVHLNVDLRHPMAPVGGVIRSVVVLTTGVTVPIGQTVVLGAATTTSTRQALILAVRPQLAPAKR